MDIDSFVRIFLEAYVMVHEGKKSDKNSECNSSGLEMLNIFLQNIWELYTLKLLTFKEHLLLKEKLNKFR